MEIILNAVNIIIHFDKHLIEIIQNFGNWSYLLLFIVIFAETGLVITPFLPGDSLLFAVGALAARGALDAFWLFVILAGAAIIGDTVNYFLGRYFGHRILRSGGGRFFKKEHIDETHKFYEKHGGKTIILARFIPIIRTFAPFVAGIGNMNYVKFVVYNIVGALLWVAVFLSGGYFFGNMPVVRNNFLIAMLGIMLVSVIPILVGFLKVHKEKKGY